MKAGGVRWSYARGGVPPLDFCCGFGGGGSEFLHKFDLTPSLLLVATCCLWWLPVRLIRFSFEQPVCPYIIFPHVVPPAGNVLHFHRRQGSKRSPERPFLFFFNLLAAFPIAEGVFAFNDCRRSFCVLIRVRRSVWYR